MNSEKTRNSEVHIEVSRVPLSAAGSLDWSRVAFYLVGSLVGLMLLMQLSRSMKTADTELDARDLAGVLGFFEGTWHGTEQVYLHNGEKYAEDDVAFEFISKNPTEQIVTETRTRAEAPAVHETWCQVATAEGQLRREPRGGQVNTKPFDGRWQDGQLFWHRDGAGSSELLRYWVSGGVLHLEGLRRAEDGSGRLMVVSGRYERNAPLPATR